MAHTMSFAELLREIRAGYEISQKQLAKNLGLSPQYLCDLENGRRTPSVEFVNRACAYFSRGPEGRLEWHRAAARAHGWEV